jgi:lactate dehydrogenase-like 2-hydroxyacid dehydrogenase
MARSTRILFLDDDPVTRIAYLVLTDRHEDPWLHDYFAPEDVNLSRLVRLAQGLRAADGVEVTMGSADPVGATTGATIIVFRRGVITRALLEANPGLRLVQRLGERSDAIDIQAAADRGVYVSCLPRVTLTYTAEHTLLLMLALAKQLLSSDRAVRDGCFDPARVHPIDDVAYNWVALPAARGVSGATLGIVGLGEVGTLVAKLARGFGMRVLYHNRHRISPEQERALGVSHAPLRDLLEQADFVSLHAVNIPENDKLAGREFFAAMRKEAFFVNTSRGRLVDEDALFDALTCGGIAGAGLDVHRVEPRKIRDRFALLPNVILTPHVAGGSISGLVDELAPMLENCHAVLAGRAPTHCIGVARAPET